MMATSISTGDGYRRVGTRWLGSGNNDGDLQIYHRGRGSRRSPGAPQSTTAAEGGAALQKPETPSNLHVPCLPPRHLSWLPPHILQAKVAASLEDPSMGERGRWRRSGARCEGRDAAEGSPVLGKGLGIFFSREPREASRAARGVPLIFRCGCRAAGASCGWGSLGFF